MNYHLTFSSMKMNFCFLFKQFVIFFSQYYLITTEPLHGNNVVNAEKMEFPFVVSIMRINYLNPNPQRDHVCTGTLITKKDVVTAMHCLVNEIQEGIQIVAGSNDLRHGRKFNILWWLTYENWATIMKVFIEFDVNDIASLRLIESVPDEISPALLLKLPNSNFYKSEVIITGWGWSNNTEVSPFLKKVNVIILTNEDCKKKLSMLAKRQLHIDKRHAFCSKAHPYALLNNGDSGGPILYNNYLLGVNKGTGPNNMPENHLSLLNIHMCAYFYREFLLNAMDTNN